MVSDPETRVLADGPGQAKLVLPGVELAVVEGPDRGAKVAAKQGRVQVGTASDNDLPLTDSAVSRRHLALVLKGDEIWLRDLGSTNGTTVDGVRVVEAQLSPSSLIRVGGTAIRVTPVEQPVTIPLSTREQVGGLIGRSVAMRQVFSIIERVAATEATVLVQGETGTGKELVAEALHDGSARSEGPFVTFDCGAVTSNLIESALFGHVRGSFTGATADRRGAFEEAHEGTLFLDEIGELPLELQPKLLRALENREIRRVGESRSRNVDVRIVAATNRELAAEVNRGSFREDLYFRLAVVEVRLPPLRTRREDIPLLVRHFVHQLAPGSPAPSREVLEALATKPWPGNVRELRNAVERALALSGGEHGSEPGALSAVVGAGNLLEEVVKMPYKDGLERWVALFERSYLEHVLNESGGSVSEAARIADVSRKHIQRLVKRHGLRED